MSGLLALALTAPAPGSVCLPPGMPDLSTLVVVGQQVMVAPVEGGEGVLTVIAVGYARRPPVDETTQPEGAPPRQIPLAFIGYWLGPILTAVDDHPGDPSEPDIVDTGMISPRGALLAERKPTCDWRRLRRGPMSPGPEGRLRT